MLDENRSERAIIILDMINKFAHVEGSCFTEASVDVIPFLQGEVQYFRERMRPVIFGNTGATAPAILTEREQFDQQVIQPLSPRNGELLVRKTRPNAFFQTELLDILLNLKIRNLTIVGAFSHTSVLMTAASALDCGFSVVVPETCVYSQDPEDHAAALRLIHRWLNDHQQ